MFLVADTIAERLRSAPHFQTWDVRDGLSMASKQAFPAVDVRVLGAQVEAGSPSAATVSPSIAVRLIAERGDRAAEVMDAGFKAALRRLHGLRIKDTTGQAWNWLKLSAVRDLPVSDGYVGCELIFVSDSEFTGDQCDC